MSKRKSKPKDNDLTISVIVTVHADPDRESMATYSAAFDVQGPEHVVEIVKTAYALGQMNGGIDAFIRSALRPITTPAPTVHRNAAGTA